MRGLGDAILCARAFIDNEPFAVLLGDDIVYNPEMPALKQLMDMYTQTGATILGCQQVPKEKVSSYGIVAGVPTINEQLMKVNDMIENQVLKKLQVRWQCLADISSLQMYLKCYKILSQAKVEKYS